MAIKQTYSSDGPISSCSSSATEFQRDPADAQVPSADYDRPAVDPLARPENIGVVARIVNGIVCPNLQFLLANVVGVVDASIPNKEQNRAVKDIIRKQFDGVWIEIERLCWPNANFCGPDGDYMLHPEPNRAKAYARAGCI